MGDRIRGVFSWPSRKMQEMQKHFSNLTPYQHWKLVTRTVGFLLSLIGINIFSDCKRNWQTAIAGLCSVQYKTLATYTIWYYWNENKITSVQGLTVLTLDVAVMLALPIILD